LYRAPFQNGIAKRKQLALNKPNIIQHKLILGKFYQEAELNYFVEETKTPTPKFKLKQHTDANGHRGDLGDKQIKEYSKLNQVARDITPILQRSLFFFFAFLNR
jgi:hypothetical protein